MRDRGVRSPDRADAVLAAIAIKPIEVYTSLDDALPGWMDILDPETRDDVLDRLGSIAGD